MQRIVRLQAGATDYSAVALVVNLFISAVIYSTNHAQSTRENAELKRRVPAHVAIGFD